MIKHIDKVILKEFLLNTIEELSIKKKFSMNSKFKFIIVPNQELDKKHDSIDDLMRLGMFTDINIKGKEFDMDTLIKMLGAAPHSTFPMWINVSVIKIKEDEILFIVEMSLRFRLPKIIQNQETGHPPFKSIV